jgi:hyperosmotically inducible periplasmic protein
MIPGTLRIPASRDGLMASKVVGWSTVAGGVVMIKRSGVSLVGFVLLLTLVAIAPMGAFAQDKTGIPAQGSQRYEQWLNNEVRHELVLLPWYSVFDDLEYQVNGTEVTLAGQVVQPVTKDDAEKAVKSIEGVTKVTNNIEVLPLSPMDDQTRRTEFRAIYGDPALERYAMGTLLPIRIIVKNGRVTLEGVVNSQSDKDLATVRANSVPFVFAVTNNLRVLPKS